MINMNDATDDMAQRMEAFRKIWEDTFSKMTSAGMSVNPGAPPPEAFREIRSGVFRAMAESWEAYMRTPEFLKNMKQSMDTAMAVKSAMNEYLTRMHQDLQGTAQEDIDNLLVAIRHTETRVLEAVEAMEQRVNARLDAMEARASAPAVKRAPGKKKVPAKKKVAKAKTRKS